MKKAFLLPISLVITLSLLTWACEEDETGDETCVAFDSPVCADLSFSACSDDNGDYYEYNGSKYYCSTYYTSGDSDSCSGAADKIVEVSGCAATSGVVLKSAQESYVSFVLNAMKEVRAQAKAAAGCN